VNYTKWCIDPVSLLQALKRWQEAAFAHLVVMVTWE